MPKDDEYRDVLSRPKFHLSKGIVDAIISAFHDNGLYIDAEHINIDLPDPKDLVFYEVTMEERKTEPAYLITENIRHFPSNFLRFSIDTEAYSPFRIIIEIFYIIIIILLSVINLPIDKTIFFLTSIRDQRIVGYDQDSADFFLVDLLK